MKNARMMFLMTGLVLLLSALPGLAEVYEYELDETYSIDPDGTLFLSTDDAEVTIVGSDRKDVHIKVYHRWDVSGVTNIDGADFFWDVVEADGDLRCSEHSEGSFSVFFGSIRETYRVEIEAPGSINLRLHGEDDDYRIRGFAGEVRLDFEDGDAILREMTGNHFEFSVEDGDVDMIGGKGLLDASIEDGSISVEGGAYDDVSVDVEDGDAMLHTSLADNGRYYFNAEDGDIELVVAEGGGRFHLSFEDGRVRSSGKFKELDDDEDSMELELPGGNAKVRMNVEDGRITLRAE